MARVTAPLVITLSAREVVAAGEAFRERGESLSDPWVALDEILSLRAGQEPLVIRVRASGGSRAERGLVEGDWLCDSGGAAPARLRPPDWGYDAASQEWARRRTWVGAWEECRDGRWSLAAADEVVEDRRVVTLAACAVARMSLGRVPLGEARPLRAIEAAEAWARGRGAAEDAVAAAHRSDALASHAQAHAGPDSLRAARAAANAAYAVRYSFAAADAATFAALALTAGGDSPGTLAAMADVVRRAIPAVVVLRGART